jgi:hypothetical protein
LKSTVRWFALTISLATAALLGGNVTAVGTPELRSSSLATFEERMIDLKAGWGDAQSCVVHSTQKVTCYRTAEEADSALGYDPSRDAEGRRIAIAAGIANLPACANGWICIWEHTYGGGRRLIFNDEYWHWLGSYGFLYMTSSWRNNQGGGIFGCGGNDSGALRIEGFGDTALGACTAVMDMGIHFNDWATDIHG